ncbi:MAG: peptide MFS transporter [Nannocystaceae bacterium]
MSTDLQSSPAEQTLFGHPVGLFVLFFAEMWERFCYYGMRALLILYLTKSLLMGDAVATGIYGAYTALVYAAPVVGGRVADSLLGYRNAVIMGGILMALGEFALLGDSEFWLYFGMGLIIVGNGYFKANISSIVGRLYRDGDERRDSGFTIFYMGINIGALLATTVCAGVGETYGYHYGFGLAGIGMLVGVGGFILGQGLLGGKGAPPDSKRLNESVFVGLSRFHLTILASLAAVPVLYFLLQNEGIVSILLIGLWLLVNGSLIANALGKKDKVMLHRTFALIILQFLNIAFWACFEQAGTSLTLFADRGVDRSFLFGTTVPASVTQSANAFFIIVFGSVFSAMWIFLDRVGRNPNIPLKFGLGIIQAGLGFLVLVAGAASVGDGALVPLMFLVLMYLLHTTGELFLSPIGLSMVTKLVPKSMTGTVMGAWFLSFALANKLAAFIAGLTGEGADYIEVFSTMGWVLIVFGGVVCLLAGAINRLMHGVK